MTLASRPNNDFAKAIRKVRKSKRLSQEDFGVVSSRTYVSTLERGLKSPTLSKIDTLAEVMDVHPLTLLVLAYVDADDPRTVNKMLDRVAGEIADLR